MIPPLQTERDRIRPWDKGRQMEGQLSRAQEKKEHKNRQESAGAGMPLEMDPIPQQYWTI